MIGQLLSERYKVLKYLGGGMSSVYLAEDIILNRNVVVKMIKVDAHDKGKSRLRFQREVESTIQLSHPNIVNVLDVDETVEYQLLVTEMVDGPTLKQYIEENHEMSIDEAVGLSVQILKGIEHAHERGIIHRDIKPQNILLDAENKVRITDFGIAKALSETRMTETNQVMGSVQYISPEQAKGQNTDERTDIYSFGIVLFELLTGQVPFGGETPVAVALKQISESLPDTDDYREVPQGLKNIMLRCTEKHPEDRYRYVETVLEDLKKYRDNTAPYVKSNENDEDRTIVTKAVTPAAGAAAVEASDNDQSEEGPPGSDEEKPEKKKRRALWLIPILFLLLGSGLLIYMFIDQNGTATVNMPDFEGMPYEEAEAMLEDYELVPGGVTEEYSETVDENYVIETSPGSGVTVDEGSPVNFTVSQGTTPYAMEDFTGTSYSDIMDTLGDLGFNSVSLVPENSEAPPGTVNNQSIESGEEVYPEEHDLELGVETYSVPDFTETDYSSAEETLSNVSFNEVNREDAYHDEYDEGTVISQSVDPGTDVYPHEGEITLNVSQGPEAVEIVDYAGQSVETARSALEEEGFDVNVTEELYNESVKEGNVISQSPNYGNFLPGSTIDLIVSLGEEPPQNVQFATTVDIPYGKENPDSEDTDSGEDAEGATEEDTDEEDGEADSENPPKTVNIYVDDANNSIDDVHTTLEITEDTSETIRLEIEPDESGMFIVEVGGEEVINEEIPYE